MLTRKTIGGVAAVLVVVGLMLAGPSYAQTTDDEVVDVESTVAIVADALAENCKNHEDEEDYIWDDNDVIPIVLNDERITIDGDGATADSNGVTITAPGTYSLTGTLTDGQIVVDVNDKGTTRLILSGVDVTCLSSAPIFVKNAKKTVIVLAENSENHVTDKASYARRYSTDDDDEDAEEKPNATIFSKDDLTLCGSGTLTVEAKNEDGIASKDGLILAGGTITVTAVDDGIRGKDYLVIEDGYVTVTVEGDGLKSDNDTDTTKGYILVEGGDLFVTSEGDALAAETDILITGGTIDAFSGGGSSRTVSDDTSAKGLKGVATIIIDNGTVTINSADDAVRSNGSVFVNGGTVDIATGDDGVQADVSITIRAGTVSLSNAVEGLESPSITIDGGYTNVVASDDGINATRGQDTEANDGSILSIQGGTLVVSTTRGDGLDSNGSIEMTGGTVIVHGPQSQPELGMDCNGSCTLSGGFFVIAEINSNMRETPSTSSSQCSVVFTSESQISASTLFHVEDADGNDIITFAPEHNYSSVTFSCPDLVIGGTYSIYTGGSSTGTVTDGLYQDGTYTPGTQKVQFTITSTVTKVGSSNDNSDGGPGEPDIPGRHR